MSTLASAAEVQLDPTISQPLRKDHTGRRRSSARTAVRYLLVSLALWWR